MNNHNLLYMNVLMLKLPQSKDRQSKPVGVKSSFQPFDKIPIAPKVQRLRLSFLLSLHALRSSCERKPFVRQDRVGLER